MDTMPVRDDVVGADASSCDLARALLHAAHVVEGQLEAALEGVGMSLAKLSVLRHLVEAGEPLPLSHLADRCSCVRSNMTQLVDRLESDGLVRRMADPSDRRSVRASLTRAGQRRHDDALRLLQTREREITSALEAGECARLIATLARLTQGR
jgi:DNA-binding MarR family transcriptional regulator